MKRNRGGEQDLDHIISAAIRGMDRAMLEYPVTPGLIFCLDRAFPYPLNEIIVEKAIAYRGRGVVGIDIAGPESLTFRARDYRRLFDRARRKGLGITVHSGEAGPVEEIGEVIEQLEPSRIGHGVKAAYDPRTMAMLRERGIILEVCPTSNLNTRVVSGWDEFRWIFDTFRRNGVRFTINTDGPEMLKTYIRDELTTLGRLGILSHEEQAQSVEWARQASFVEGVSDMAAAEASTARPLTAGARRGLGRSAGAEGLDAVGAHPIPARDVRLPDDIGAEHLAIELELGIARLRMPRGDVVDRAVGLPHPDGIGGATPASRRRSGALAQVALLVLDDGQLAHALPKGCRHRVGGLRSGPLMSAACRRRRSAKTASTIASSATTWRASSRSVARLA